MANTRLLTTAEVAMRLGISPRTVVRMVEDGELPATTTQGGHRRIAETEVESYLARRGHAAAPGAITLAIANQKGGVGKTTLTANLGVLLHQLGARVLLVDLDPQGHLTFTMGLDPDGLTQTIYDAMLTPRAVPIDNVIVPTGFGPDLAPINLVAADADTEFGNKPMWGGFLAKILAGVRDRYDYILIDSAPNLGKLTVTAFMTADWLIVPTQPQMLSIRGLQLLLERIDEARSDANAQLQIAGAVPMMMQTSNADQTMDQALRRALNIRAIRVFRNAIPYSTVYKEAANARSIQAYLAPQSKHTTPYRLLLAEILAVVGGPAAAQLKLDLTEAALPAAGVTAMVGGDPYGA
ncbi:MAG: AAA family ATPase [Chloroflexota bacterium]|nr:AAA family ATPase [Chloroflexota bacterium]